MRLLWIVLLTVFPLLVSESASGDEPSVGEVVAQAGFGTGEVSGWENAPETDAGYQDSRALRFDQPAAAGSRMASLKLPAEHLRGCLLCLTAMIKAQAVSPRTKTWHGVKFMLHCRSSAGEDWPQAATEDGTYDWREVGFAVRVPRDATGLDLSLGLEQVTGTAWSSAGLRRHCRRRRR